MLQHHFADDPLADYYNLDGLSDVVLTGDVDWAPDYAIEHILRVVEGFGHKIILYATHPSSILASPPDFLEVGWHPDFTRHPSLLSPRERMDQLKDWYPGAVGMRSHRNVFGQNIADIAADLGLRYDVSSLLWNQPLCQGHVDYNGMVRFSYMWEDGLHLDMNMGPTWDRIRLHCPGLKILNIHPILIYLNCRSDNERREVTRRYSDLTTAPKVEIDADRFSGFGIGSLWLQLLERLAENDVRTSHLKDIVSGVLATQQEDQGRTRIFGWS
jgi:hypothetical protein